MHVLVTESRIGDSDRLTARLRDAGVAVTRCHDETGLCRALTAGGCPLDEPNHTVDLVLDVRGPVDELTTREYGAVCAVRAGVPLRVVPVEPHVPTTAPDGLQRHAAVMTEDEAVGACSGADRTVVAALLGWPGNPDSATEGRQ